MKLMENVKRFIRDERGLETVEYAVMAALIAAGTIATVILLKDKIISVFSNLITAMTTPA